MLLISDSVLVNKALMQTDIVPVPALYFAIEAFKLCMIFQHGVKKESQGDCYLISDFNFNK